MRLDGIENRTAAVTGAGRGIGRAIAEMLAENGARVALLEINKNDAEACAEKLRSSGAEAMAVQCDVSSEEQVQEAFPLVTEQFGGVDILVNNAGIFELKSTEETTAEDWDRMMAVNLRGPFLCSRAVITRLKKQRWGKIVNVGSSAGKTGGAAKVTAYAVSKAGLMCFTKALASELASYNVNVNAVAPTLIETNMIKDIAHCARLIPLGRLGTTKDVASVVAFLCSEGTSFLTGEIVDVNGGFLMD